MSETPEKFLIELLYALNEISNPLTLQHCILLAFYRAFRCRRAVSEVLRILVCRKEQQVLTQLTTSELDGYVGQKGNLALFLLCSCSQLNFTHSRCSDFIMVHWLILTASSCLLLFVIPCRVCPRPCQCLLASNPWPILGDGIPVLCPLCVFFFSCVHYARGFLFWKELPIEFEEKNPCLCRQALLISFGRPDNPRSSWGVYGGVCY